MEPGTDCMNQNKMKDASHLNSFDEAEAEAEADDVDCRICREYEPIEKLISPCNCSGSLALVHTSCLRQWRLQQSQTVRLTHCDICLSQFAFIKQPTLYTFLKSMACSPLPNPSQIFDGMIQHLLIYECSHLTCNSIRCFLFTGTLFLLPILGKLVLDLCFRGVMFFLLIDQNIDEMIFPHSVAVSIPKLNKTDIIAEIWRPLPLTVSLSVFDVLSGLLAFAVLASLSERVSTTTRWNFRVRLSHLLDSFVKMFDALVPHTVFGYTWFVLIFIPSLYLIARPSKSLQEHDGTIKYIPSYILVVFSVILDVTRKCYQCYSKWLNEAHLREGIEEELLLERERKI